MRARVTMEQEDWRAGSAVVHPQLSLADVDPLAKPSNMARSQAQTATDACGIP